MANIELTANYVFLLLSPSSAQESFVHWNGPRYQRVLALCAFLTGVIPKGLILRKFCVQCLCIFFFLCKFVPGLIFWFLDELWFDDLRVE